MVTFFSKILVCIIILFIALIGGLFPILIRTTNRTKRFLIYGESFAGGIFLGAGLIHLLPDAQAAISHVWRNGYPIVYVICAFSIVLLRIIEDGVVGLFKHSHSKQTWIAYLLAILLSIHSVLAGTALGVETTLAIFLIVFFAIIAHKGSAAFALGVSMRKSELKKSTMIYLMLLFAVMTPIGILSGAILSHFLQANSGKIAEATFNAIAAGTFIYIAVFNSLQINNDEHCPGCEDYQHLTSSWKRLFAFTMGTTIMAVIAIWL